MKILLNAYNLKVAGGLNVAFNFIQQLSRYPDDEFYVFSPENCGYEKLESNNVHIHVVPDRFQSYFYRFYLDHVWMRKRVHELQPDAIFSMGNFALPVRQKQALLFHYPYLIYPRSKKFKLRWWDKVVLVFQRLTFRNRLKYVNIIFPQTTIAGTRLKRIFGEHLPVKTVPNAYTKLESNEQLSAKPLLESGNATINLICLSKYYPHKNIEVLVDVATFLKKYKSSIRLNITISGDQHSGAQRLLEEIDRKGLGEYIRNIGPVSLYDVPELYREADGLILPTLLESFTATYVDAMRFGKPIFTSDLDFAKEICGDVAFYFNAEDGRQIYEVLEQAFQHPDEIERKVALGEKRIYQFLDWEHVADMYLQSIKAL